ncbi:MAG: sugar phosphate nucleotidyltransferase [Ginsengibacter sp.]
MKPTLLILAAGMASRYGSMKQIEAFGPSGETIMDYSIYDAIRAGFGKVVFVIRRNFADEFKNIFEQKLKDKIATGYVYQDLDDYTEGFTIPVERKKPWGTAHAVLCAKEVIKEPFAVINADDFYGKDAFEKAVAFLSHEVSPSKYCIIGYQLSKTLSEHGTVSRGVCEVDGEGNLVSIKERTKIYMEKEPAGDEAKIVFEDEEGRHEVPFNSQVSMNFWGFDSTVFPFLEKLFQLFLTDHITDPKSEFFIPLMGDAFIRENGTIKVIPTSSQWFGVTYKEDAPIVKKDISQLVKNGEYPEDLWNT